MASHSLWTVGRFTFCAKCGARSSQRVRLLKGECPRAPTSASTARNLRLLKEGRDPTLAGSPFLGRPVPDSTLMAKLRGSSSSSAAPPSLDGASDAVSELIFQALPVVNVHHVHVDEEADDLPLCVFCTD